MTRALWLSVLALWCAGCASQGQEPVRAEARSPRVKRFPAPEESGAWAQPRDRRRFSDWPDVRSASGSEVDKHLENADRFFDRGDYHSAIDSYSKAILLDPESAYAFCNRGSALRRLEDYEGAINDLTVAIGLRRDYALAYNNRGYALLKSGDAQGAIDDFGEAIRIGDQGFPSYSLAMTYRNRAKAWRELGEGERAAADEEKARRIEGRRRAN